MTVKEITEKLKSISLFSETKDIESVIEMFPPKAITLGMGEKYVTKSALVLFVNGKADIVKEQENKIAYLKTVSDICVFGLGTLFAEEGDYISTLVAKTETVLLEFSQDFVTALVSRDSEFSLRLIKLLCQKVRYLNRRIDYYTCPGAEGKVHEFLTRSCDDDGVVVMSMSKLSDTLGIARASLYRAVTALEEKGYIIKDGKKIQLLK